ncbi:hypothetical protein [Brevibacillus brevis]|uniref:hypothetical protein n=1 Tax=Brevibacillus brevis TaxID=1393 RepID=UPI00165E73FD|nr:hypothetical protein [Brevibacillus brevis]
MRTYTFIPYVGFAFIMLGGFRLLGYSVNEKLMVSMTVAAALFAVSDLFSFLEETIKAFKTEQLSRKQTIFIHLFGYLSTVLIFFAISFMLVFPTIGYLDNVSKENISKINDSATLIGLGTSIFLMGAKHFIEVLNEINNNKKKGQQKKEIDVIEVKKEVHMD